MTNEWSILAHVLPLARLILYPDTSGYIRGHPDGLFAFLHQNVSFFYTTFCFFLEQILKFRKIFFGKNWCKKSKKMV